MTQPEYEQKKRECWEKYIKLGGNNNGNSAPFNMVFRYAYSLGKQAKAAEGEEMLTVPKRNVQEMYAANTRLRKRFAGTEIGYYSAVIMRMLRELFGSKCLPDELLSQNSAENCDNENLISKAEPIETYTDDCSSQCKSQNHPNRDLCDKLMRRGFRDHNRLNIATRIATAILGNPDEVYRAKTCGKGEQIPQNIAEYAVAIADALISEAERKGGSK